jgi:hypothetical protein
MTPFINVAFAGEVIYNMLASASAPPTEILESNSARL